MSVVLGWKRGDYVEIAREGEALVIQAVKRA